MGDVDSTDSQAAIEMQRWEWEGGRVMPVEGKTKDKEPRPPRSEDELASALDRIFQTWIDADAETIAKLFGALPEWLPEPGLPRIRQAVETLRNSKQSPERIDSIVKQVHDDRLTVPGTVLDEGDFTKSAHYLAHVQWALSQGKQRASEILAGSRAARDYRRSKAGNEAQHEARFGAESRDARNARICRSGEAVLAQNPSLTLNGVAAKLAPQEDLGTRQISRILRQGLPLKK
jgi:hypothetical protein